MVNLSDLSQKIDTRNLQPIKWGTFGFSPISKALKSLKSWAHPRIINTDKAPTYGVAITELKREGKCSPETEHHQVKYLNNIVEADHGKLKRLIKPTLGFKSMETAYATIKGFEVMLAAFKKGQFKAWMRDKNVLGEVRLINENFQVYIL